MRNYIRKTRGPNCELCGLERGNMGLFHILPRGKYPKIQLLEENVLWACWLPCHHNFHHDPFYAKEVVFPKITEIRGKGWEDSLKAQDKMAQSLSPSTIEMHKVYYEQKLGH